MVHFGVLDGCVDCDEEWTYCGKNNDCATLYYKEITCPRCIELLMSELKDCLYCDKRVDCL